ncbi:MAG: stage 0 sporulation family protein, partial [Clostridia bacterium]
MPNIVGIKFNDTSKTYYFAPQDIVFAVGEGAIVETARGLEYGKVAIANKEVADTEIVDELKPVIRKATDKDLAHYKENIAKKPETMKTVQEKIRKHNLAMKLTGCDYTFDNSKLIIYFTSETRVDFRDLVKDLAGIFHLRIELRQIGIRDECKMLGGFGPCGRPCCCSSYLDDFAKVSIKMAKTQGLSLNPAKISGLCGRLMCCLKYENQYYADATKLMPKLGSEIDTPD